jgi:hypothetical protein
VKLRTGYDGADPSGITDSIANDAPASHGGIEGAIGVVVVVVVGRVVVVVVGKVIVE